MERLFEPFLRGDVRDSRQGLGLGLHIASQIARAHGGRIDVTSTSDETRFVFSMPAEIRGMAGRPVDALDIDGILAHAKHPGPKLQKRTMKGRPKNFANAAASAGSRAGREVDGWVHFDPRILDASSATTPCSFVAAAQTPSRYGKVAEGPRPADARRSKAEVRREISSAP